MKKATHLAAQAAGACALALGLLSSAQAVPSIKLSGTNTSAGFALTVSAQDVVDLYGYQFTVQFDPSLLTATGSMEAGFLASGGATDFAPGVIDNSAGSISFVLGFLVGPVAGVSGSGDLATFNFGVRQAGLASFSLSDVGLVDTNIATIDVNVDNLVTAVPEPATYGLFALGLVALLGATRQRRPQAGAV
ncbi:cohesin domain-containing protein [uncultured Aquincola sp.]|uniref:cohesin domain-containing protein n=1 Tax=uncultured Aquincola sp. TaxID=886556 RepID=UPI0032B201B6